MHSAQAPSARALSASDLALSADDAPGWRRQALMATAIITLLLLAWDASDLDMALAHLAGGPGGFPLRDHWLFEAVLHNGGRYLGWLVELGLTLAVWWPPRWLAGLGTSRRLQLAVTPLVLLLAVSSLKAVTGISCPWDLSDFGGVARHASHWARMLAPDGGSGRCFPAGHASAGFAFVGGWFVLRDTHPRLARRWLAASLIAGLVLGLSQQMRGAHFMSHTLWAAWLCWMLAWLIDLAWPLVVRPGAVPPDSDIA